MKLFSPIATSIWKGHFRIVLATLFLLLGLTAWASISASQDSGESQSSNPEMGFSNAAQAQHAENVATPAAMEDPEVAAAMAEAKLAAEELEQARKALDEARASNDQAAINAAQQAFEEAQAAFEVAHAHAIATFAETVGVITQDIADMRASGMGWGEIAQHFGVHPGVLGLGHSRTHGHFTAHTSMHFQMRSEIEEATTRSYTGGKEKGHGFAGMTVGSKGLGLAHAKGAVADPGHGLALGHTHGHGIGHGAGHGVGHGIGHGGGHGAGHGAGGGHGGGNK